MLVATWVELEEDVHGARRHHHEADRAVMHSVVRLRSPSPSQMPRTVPTRVVGYKFKNLYPPTPNI